MDLTASSAVNLPITSASLRLVVVLMGVRSIRSTYSWTDYRHGSLSTNFVFFMGSPTRAEMTKDDKQKGRR
jgi:hypothetical protein